MIYSLLLNLLLASTLTFHIPTSSCSSLPVAEEEVRVSRTFERVPEKNQYLVTVLIHAEGKSGFGRFTEFLPPGVIVNVVESGAASVNISAEKLKFIWVSLPEVAQLKVSYTIVFPENKLVMYYRGEFSYVFNKGAQIYKLQPKDLKLIGE